MNDELEGKKIEKILKDSKERDRINELKRQTQNIEYPIKEKENWKVKKKPKNNK